MLSSIVIFTDLHVKRSRGKGLAQFNRRGNIYCVFRETSRTSITFCKFLNILFGIMVENWGWGIFNFRMSEQITKMECDIYYCMKSVHVWIYCGPYFRAVGRNMERYGVSLRIYSECGKIRARITPNTNTFNTVYMKYVHWRKTFKIRTGCKSKNLLYFY